MQFNTMILFSSVLLFLYSCNDELCTNKKIEITPIPSWSGYDTTSTIENGKYYDLKFDFYLVTACKYDRDAAKQLNSIAYKIAKDSIVKYSCYCIYFYKCSNETNLQTIASKPGVIDPYSEDRDLFYVIEWIHGKLSNWGRYQNGKIVESNLDISEKNIEVRDVP